MTALYRNFQTVGALDDEYDPSRRVADFADYARRFKAESGRAAAGPNALLGQPYGLTQDEYLDIYPPGSSTAEPQPVFVFIHGGYWRMFSARDFALASAGPCAHGMLSVVPNYTLAPQAPLAEIVRQMRAAVVWVARNIVRHGGDPTRIVVGGHSAGGQLAAMIALTDWSQYGFDHNPVHAVHAISGVFDLTPLPYTYLAPHLQLSPREVQQLSPVLHPLPPQLPPFCVSYGDAESSEFCRQSVDFVGRLNRHGHTADLLPLAGENHFDAVLGLADASSVLTRHVVASAMLPPSGR